MKLKAIYLLAIFILLAACSPQVTAGPEATATLPPPTETPIPTPTVHPQFLEWQESIAALSERFALMPDGSIQDNGVPVPGMRVSPDGVMTLTLADGMEMTLDSSDVSFDDEEGFGVDGYELNDDGEWVEAESKAMQAANELVETYKLGDKVTVTEEGDLVKVVDKGTGKVLIETDGSSVEKYGLEPVSRFDLEFAVDTIAKNSCESKSEIIPSKDGLVLATSFDAYSAYLMALVKDLKYHPTDGTKEYSVLVDREKLCWASITGNNLLYRNSEGVAIKLSLIPSLPEEILEFRVNR